ncbi:MAG TPA: ribonuclease HI [Candidatus Sulfotelmatobacter sp.]|nr:ribonuclease HI [Candidatus Sulfotelmatobacter sp.]
MKQITIHSDGACEGNPGPGGWAAILQYGPHRREIAGAALATTNNRMELQAALEALRALKEPCEVQIHSDSEYLRDGMTLWLRAWKFRGWKTKEKQPVKNSDLWKALDELATRHKVSWHWLKGHAGHPLNERCDLLAKQQIRTLRSRHPGEDFKRALAAFKTQNGTPPATARPHSSPTVPFQQAFTTD